MCREVWGMCRGVIGGECRELCGVESDMESGVEHEWRGE